MLCEYVQDMLPSSEWERGRSMQIRLNVYSECAGKRSPAFIRSDVGWHTSSTPGPNFVKTLAAHAFFLLKTCE